MADNDEQFTDEQVDDLVNQYLVYIGERLQEGARYSFSSKGARHLMLYAEAEIANIRERVFGKDGKDPVPEIRNHTLRSLREKFPEPLPPRP